MSDFIATIDLAGIKADKSVPKEVLEVYTYLKIFMDYSERADWLERRKKAWDAMENKMWSDKQKAEMEKQGQIPLTINKINKGVQGSSAIVTDQKPEIKFLPVGSSDLYVAELLKRAHDLLWHKSNGMDITYDVVEESKVGSLGFFSAAHDPSKGMFGRINIYEEPPEDIYFDKNSKMRDLSDTHIIKAKLRTKSYIMDTYDDITEDDLIFKGEGKDDPQKSTGVTGRDNYKEGPSSQTPDDANQVYVEPEIYWEIDAWMLKKEKEQWAIVIDKDGNATPIQMNFESKKPSKDDIKAELARIKKESGAAHVEHWPRVIEKRYQRIIVGKKLVSEEVNPYGEDAEGDPVLFIIPLGHQRTRSAYYMSPTNYALEINKEKNKRRAQFIYAASQNINAPIVEPANKVKWTGIPGTPGSRAEVEHTAAFQPTRLPPGSYDIGKFAELEAIADEGIDDQYDLHDVMRGKIPPGQQGASGRMVLALQDFGGTMSKPFLRRLESALIKLGKLDIVLILKHWTREMWERLLEDNEKPPDGTPEAADETDLEDPQVQAVIAAKYKKALDKIRPIDPTEPPGISLIDLDVRITAGSSMPTNRIAKQQVAIEMVGAGIYDAQAALDYTDDPMADKIKLRLKAAQAPTFLPEKKGA